MRILNRLLILIQWGVFMTLTIMEFISLLILCGEDTPGQPMSDRVFFGTKITAGAVLYLCILAGKYFNRRGWLPEINDPEEDDGWED